MADQLQESIDEFLHLENRDIRSINRHNGSTVGSSLGKVRRDNQDRALIVDVQYAVDRKSDFRLAVLCDGIGGMHGGGRAAEVAASALSSCIIRSRKIVEPRERLSHAVAVANKSVFNLLLGKGGTTMSAVLSCAYAPPAFLNVGDSRVYEIDKSRNVRQLSRDDTFGELLQRNNKQVVDRSRSQQLVQFVGLGEGIDPSIQTIDSNSEWIFLTSDGLHGSFPEVFSLMIKNCNAGDELLENAMAISEILGGVDNASGILLTKQTDKTERVFRNDGIRIALISPYKTAEIWLPGSAQNSSSEFNRAVQEVPTSSRVAPSHDPATRQKQVKAISRQKLPAAKKTRRAKSDSKRKSNRPTPELLLEFPDQD